MPDSRISVSAEAAPEFSDRLLAEAVRLHEEARGAPLDEPDADEAARATPGDFECRVLVRAQRLSIAQPLRAALHHLRAGISVAFALGLVAAFAAGCASARVVLGSYTEGPVNFFLALTALLGLHTIVLLDLADLHRLPAGKCRDRPARQPRS